VQLLKLFLEFGLEQTVRIVSVCDRIEVINPFTDSGLVKGLQTLMTNFEIFLTPYPVFMILGSFQRVFDGRQRFHGLLIDQVALQKVILQVKTKHRSRFHALVVAVLQTILLRDIMFVNEILRQSKWW